MLLLVAAVVSLVLVSETGSQATPPPPRPCSASTSCDPCLQSSRCLWCYTNNTCTDYPASHLLPSPSECQLSHARWGVCWMNFEALIIAMAMLVGVLLLAISFCCCWCCCCRRRRSGPDREEERFSRRREEIKRRSEQRTAERQTRHEDIRKKSDC
ncbi:hypothetical protein CRUP_002244 [Coryphaenoides rupestris]|nr:hypothetical protein CRUP_002244 [Coryphaenoides rupestris]